MKWGRKKPLASSFSSSTSHQTSSLISHVFPVSWLSKFKHKSYHDAERKPGKLSPHGKWHSSSVNSPKRVSERFVGNGKFYGFDDDGDAFWRLSFGHDNAEEKRKRVGFRSSHDFDGDDLLKFPALSCPNCRKKGAVKRSPRSCDIASESRLKSRRELSNAGIRSPATSPEMRTIEEQREDLNSEQTRTEISDDEKHFGQRQSLYVSMEKRRKRTKQRNSFSKVRAETCKVKAIQDMKKTRKKKKTGAETGLDSFAVVKSSFDPRKDFKESIMEMILVMNMRQSDELEELLACYLTLNSDDHHDLIITVFKEVWFELDQSRFSD